MTLCSIVSAGMLLIGSTGLAVAKKAPAQKPLFTASEPIALTIEGPLRSIARDSGEEPTWFDASLRYTETDGTQHDLTIRLRARGKNRRKTEICRFPPLRIAFDKKQTAGTVFAGQGKLKLVTHCQSSNRFQQFVIKEDLVYRLYNLLTDDSFRTRALQVTYIDTADRNRTFSKRGFLIEDRDDMARRGGGKVLKMDRVEAAQLDEAKTNLFEVFQYMIGNTDWSMLRGPAGDRCCHNAVLVGTADDTIYPVPYDFDASGFVDTPYAAPSEKLGIKDVTKRLYRGFCHPDALVAGTIGRFNAARAAMTNLIDSEPGLTNQTRSKLHKYLYSFFDTVNDPKKLDREIVRDCR